NASMERTAAAYPGGGSIAVSPAPQAAAPAATSATSTERRSRLLALSQRCAGMVVLPSLAATSRSTHGPPRLRARVPTPRTTATPFTDASCTPVGSRWGVIERGEVTGHFRIEVVDVGRTSPRS